MFAYLLGKAKDNVPQLGCGYCSVGIGAGESYVTSCIHRGLSATISENKEKYNEIAKPSRFSVDISAPIGLLSSFAAFLPVDDHAPPNDDLDSAQ